MPTEATWMQSALGALLLIGVMVSAWRLVYARPAEFQSASMLSVSRETDLAHLLMNGVMAWMLVPWAGALSRVTITLTFAALLLWFGVLLVTELRRQAPHDGATRRTKLGSYGYHLVASSAMLYAVLAMPGGNRMHDMPGMVMQPTRLAYGIAAAFLIDLLVTAVVVVFFPGVLGKAAGLSTPLSESVRFASIPHLIMDIGMILMLVAM